MTIYQIYDQSVENLIKKVKRIKFGYRCPDIPDTELKIFCIKEETKYNFRMGMISPKIDIEEWFQENIRNILIVLVEIYDLDEKVIDDICTECTENFMIKINNKYSDNTNTNKCQILSSIAICSIFTGILYYFFN